MISEKIRNDFPMLQKHKNLIYLDSAATSLKPMQVIDAVKNFYSEYGMNIGRGNHHISQQATQKFEQARANIAKFINAKENELVFTKNATEGINLVATSLERGKMIGAGDEIVISFMEHHANLVPWQQLCLRTGAKLKVVKLNKDYTLDMDDLREKVTRKTKVVGIAHCSNTVATITPAQEIAKIAHENNALFLADCAQSVPHMKVDAKKLDADFMVFSSHKMLGPTGVGALYGKHELLEKMPPFNFGGAMISKVTFEKTLFAKPPQKFEPGTMAIAEAIGFSEAVNYLKRLGMENVYEHDRKLLAHALQKMSGINGVKLHCPKNPEKQGAVVLFEVEGIDAVDLGVAVDEARNIAIRSGLHCAEPIISSINPKGLDRASFYFYNTIEEIDIFAEQVTAISRAFK